MRILSKKTIRVFYSFPHVLGRPGIGTTAWYQIQGLMAAGAEVHIVCSSCIRPIRGARTLHETMKFGPIRIPRKLFGGDRAWHLHDKAAANRLEDLVDQIDVIHCWPSGSLRTLQMAKRLGIMSFLERPSSHTRYVTEVVARECARMGLAQPENHYSSVSTSRLDREEQEFDVADYLLCPSAFVGQTFLQNGFAPNKLRYHQYGYNPSIFLPSRVSTRAEGIRALYCGEGILLKGIQIAIEGWLRSDACTKGRLAIVGTIMPSVQEALKDRLAHPSIEIIGFRHDVTKFMKSCDVLMLPSFAEGSALVTYEARASGAVLLVSDAAGARCDHMQTGMIHPAGDIEILSSQLDMLAHNPCLLENLRQASLAEIDQWTWDKAGERLLDLYQK